MRQCGECTLCCTLLPVPVLNKPKLVNCVHCASGCSIYSERPIPCRTFHCEWLKGEFKEDMRPDKSHVVFEAMTQEPLILALVEPGYGDVLPKMTYVLEHYLKEGKSVVATTGFALIPDGVQPSAVINDVTHAKQRLGVA